MLTKVIQVEGRKQLGLNFGSGGNPNCRGLTFAEILRLDFDRMDFSEFEAEVLQKMKMPVNSDLESRVKGSFPNMQSPKDERTVSPNGRDGVRNSFSSD